MELAAAQRPFLYVPLENHFEQNFHVRHRLDNYGAGRCIRYAEASDPAALAEALVEEVGARGAVPAGRDGRRRAGRRDAGGADLMRALEPVDSGFVDRDGVAIHYEVYGDGTPTVYLLMPDTIVQSRAWKAQIPFLARYFRVVVSDPRGNGQSGTPDDARADTPTGCCIDDAWAVLDAVGAEQAVLVGLCTGRGLRRHHGGGGARARARSLRDQPGTAAEPAAAAQGRVRLRRAARLVRGLAEDEPPLLASRTGRTSREFFFARDVPRAALDQAGRGLRRVGDADHSRGDDPGRLLRRRYPGNEAETVAARRRCGARCSSSPARSTSARTRSAASALAEITGGDHVVIEGGGHLPQARDPVKVNLLLRDFVRRAAAGAG